MGAQFDAQKCRKRNRVAALRDAMEATPLRFLAGGPLTEPEGIVLAEGSLPANDAEALEAINALLPAGTPPLSLSDVWIHYAEAANTNFIRKYFAFLGSSTLRNMARSAGRGVAFMNSHRTGGLSHPAELPFGKTFAGRYESVERLDGTRFERTVVGVYMLRGQRPAGESGPSTDDLHQAIVGGTLTDVSVGIIDPGGAREVCDVCGHGLYDRDEKGRPLCPHYPGSTHKLTLEERQRQLGRGVPRGVASYTIEGADLGEVSAVFRGALPGAGFRKAYGAQRSGELGSETLRELQLSYGDLWSGDLAGVPEAVLDEVAERIAERLATLRTDGDEATDEAAPSGAVTAESLETGASVPQEETDMRKHEEPGTESQAQGAEGLEASAIVTEAAAGAAAETPSVQLTEGAGEAPVPASAPASALAPAEALQAKLDEMQSRLLAVEAENATLRLQRLRGEVEGELSDLRFCEGRLSLAPASREGLTELICGLPEEPRRKALEALKGLQLVELGERGFGSPEAAATLATLSAEEEKTVADIAKRTGVTPEVAREQYLTVRATRAAS